MKSQSIVEYGAPLQETAHPDHVLTGTEVLVKIRHCGVCHSDVHLHDGYFDLGDEKKLDISRVHSLPFTLGHEIEGEVVAVGPDGRDDVSVGDAKVVYPWIGCGECATCTTGQEHLCNKPRALGVNVNGGYADHVVVPHPRYLFDFDGITAGLAATYMCSGLTAYSALRKIPTPTAEDTVAIVGLGGVGMMGLQLAKALFPHAALVGVDIDDAKLTKAKEQGATRTYNSSDGGAAKAAVKESGGGVLAAIDFVGSEASLGFANQIVRKGGQIVIVGLFGGRFSMSIPLFPMRALSIIGSYVGSLAETQELLDLVKAGKVEPIPVEFRKLKDANRSLDDLRQGRAMGRIVLQC